MFCLTDTLGLPTSQFLSNFQQGLLLFPPSGYYCIQNRVQCVEQIAQFTHERVQAVFLGVLDEHKLL